MSAGKAFDWRDCQVWTMIAFAFGIGCATGFETPVIGREVTSDDVEDMTEGA